MTTRKRIVLSDLADQPRLKVNIRSELIQPGQGLTWRSLGSGLFPVLAVTWERLALVRAGITSEASAEDAELCQQEQR